MGRTEGSHSNNNEIRHQFRLRVRTELEQLIPVLKWFENHTQSLLPETIIWQVKVALAEGFTNTVRYAHQHLPHETPIELALAIFSNYLELKIWDYGNPFDLHKKLQELKESDEDPLLKEGDRGLIFMQSLMDELDYIRLSNEQNCLIMKKKI
ncbi:putative anti-sigma regulatory factor, serine/threonine protein kinase [Gloeothece citriformis PCC 7424]|uniref:Putative anti-sigma regulatory factor, serine/threonine protein kinase n=1 Tax=Gloeothece citriformis (strain PCC 7424) TaxID=65393 RepID=B7KF50_GLOC7|nr:ATP-binding protein [Gloeothece citriformis]ACK70506.1 putative anti-sigma regulatory factor, serine/threonine protein kinase [Gloeothece citriformis PCC 7424]